MTQLLDIPHADFAQDGRSPQPIRHHLAEHELLSVEAVAALADRLPAATVEHALAKGIGVVVPGGATTLDASPGEVARGIESNGCWMVLKHIEQDPQYKRLLDDALDEIAPLLPGGAEAMLRRQGFIFLSAPESVTPAHLDFEHNFLLQIRGQKTMHTGQFASPEDEQRELERSNSSAAHRNMEYAPEWTAEWDLRPGDGLYVPVGKPHWVQNGPTVSVSLSITWRSADGLRAEHVHAFNERLRRAGVSPRRPGERPRIDQGKALLHRVYDKARHVVARGRS
jgi:hypothetical protein